MLSAGSKMCLEFLLVSIRMSMVLPWVKVVGEQHGSWIHTCTSPLVPVLVEALWQMEIFSMVSSIRRWVTSYCRMIENVILMRVFAHSTRTASRDWLPDRRSKAAGGRRRNRCRSITRRGSLRRNISQLRCTFSYAHFHRKRWSWEVAWWSSIISCQSCIANCLNLLTVIFSTRW